eukprot:scpid59885/ scgid30265/ 
MSHACTVISSFCCKAVLLSDITVAEELSYSSFPSPSLPEHFVALIRKGNSLYDEVFGPKGSPFLSAYDVIAEASMGLAIPQYGELGFNTHDKAELEIATYLERADSSVPLPAIFTAKGKSVAVIFAPDGQCLVMDSHAHGRRGGLLASCTTVKSWVHLLSNGLMNGLSLERGAALTFLSLST